MPSHTRYAAPATRIAVKSGCDAATSAAMPAAAASVQKAMPVTMPAAVRTPFTRPPTSVLRTMSAVSGPGVQITTAEIPMKAARWLTSERAACT